MLDIQLIRTMPEEVAAKLKKRGFDVDFTQTLELDRTRRELASATDELKAKRNTVSASIPQMKKAGADTQPVFDEMKKLGDLIADNDRTLTGIEEALHAILCRLPNIPEEDVLAGGKENNAVIRTYGEPRMFDFTPQNHVDICTRLNLIDYPRGAKIAGSGFWVYRGWGARMEWALINYFIDTHLKDGYELMFVPHLLNYETGYTAGQFPKFEDDVFLIGNPVGDKKQFLLPTAETALVSLHRDEILSETELPKKYIGFTPCYRREAGSYRAEERGMVRGHQFNKVEMIQYTRPEDSPAAFAELLRKAEKLVEGLGLHFNTVKLAAGDCSASMARTVDIEIHMPSMGYKEVSSVSNANDYQARRGNMRFRRDGQKKLEFVHTLNGSGLATSRILPALVEQYQQADGSVTVPEVLRPYMGIDVIR